jgi:hypothetical protein
MEPGAIFSGLSSAAAAARALKELLQRSKGPRRALLLELKKNLLLLDLHARGNGSVDQVVNRLETARYEQAVASEFDFSSFSRRKVNAEAVRGSPALRPYVCWTTEQLFESVYLKIHALKNLAALGARRGGRVRMDTRLRNLVRLMLLLLRHIGS